MSYSRKIKRNFQTVYSLAGFYDNTGAYHEIGTELRLNAIPRDISNFVFYVNLDKTSLPSTNWTLSDLLSNAKEKNNTKDKI